MNDNKTYHQRNKRYSLGLYMLFFFLNFGEIQCRSLSDIVNGASEIIINSMIEIEKEEQMIMEAQQNLPIAL